MIADFLNSTYNLNCFVGPRHDIRVMRMGNELKISGTAFRITGERAYCHGTLLLNSNLTNLKRALLPSKVSKRISNTNSIASVQSTVCNLAEFVSSISHEQIIDNAKRYFDSPIETNRIDNNELIQSQYNQFSSSNWIFGKTPSFLFHNKTVDFTNDLTIPKEFKLFLENNDQLKNKAKN